MGCVCVCVYSDVHLGKKAEGGILRVAIKRQVTMIGKEVAQCKSLILNSPSKYADSLWSIGHKEPESVLLDLNFQ